MTTVVVCHPELVEGSRLAALKLRNSHSLAVEEANAEILRGVYPAKGWRFTQNDKLSLRTFLLSFLHVKKVRAL